MLTATVFIIIGLIGRLTAHRHKSYLFGYRTPRAMKSKKAWVYANNFMFSYLMLLGVLIFMLSYFQVIISSFMLNMLGLTMILLGVFYVELKLKQKRKD